MTPCEQCPLGVAQAVASRGPVPATLLFLSGAPRHHEEHEGVAFASPLFPWLEERLAAAGIDPAGVHYATLTGCRPPRQRPPRPAEIAACAPRLDRTIEAVEPRVIVLCGPDAVAALLPGVSLSGGHGALAWRGRRRYYPLRHPYTAPHSERYVDEVMDDLRRLAALLREDLPAIGEDDADRDEASITPMPTLAPSLAGESAVPVIATADMAVARQASLIEATAVEASSAMPQALPAEQDERHIQGTVAVEDVARADTPTSVEEEELDNPTQLSLF